MSTVGGVIPWEGHSGLYYKSGESARNVSMHVMNSLLSAVDCGCNVTTLTETTVMVCNLEV